MKAIKQYSAALVAALLCLAAVQCSKNSNPATRVDSSVKTVAVAFSIKTNQEFNRVAARAIVTISSPDMDSIRQSMVITDSVMYATVHDVPVGKIRLFRIFVFDSSDIVRYYGSQQADIEPLAATYVTIKLHKPTSGDVVIIGTIADDTTEGVTFSTPAKPFAAITKITNQDTAYLFVCGNVWCSDGGHVEYGFTFVRNDDTLGSPYDSATTQWGTDSAYRYLSYPGSYLVYVHARSTINPSMESAWSEPLIVKAVSPDSIMVIDTMAVDTIIDTTVVDTTIVDTIPVIDSNTVIIGDQDSGTTLSLKSGQYFQATFRECGGCAQVWRINGIDTTQIAHMRDSISNPSCKNCVGGGHDRTFYFQAIGKGLSYLRFGYFSETVIIGIKISQ